MARIAFLGPEGTFTAEAARRVDPVAERIALGSVGEVFAAVREGRTDHGVVPIENLIEGSVNATLDQLVFGPPGVFVRGELLVEVDMALLVRPGTALADVRIVRSHPVGLGQCRDWLAANLPGSEEVAATSTAEAARELAEGSVTDPTVSAAIATPLAAERFGLEVAASGIADRTDNQTRFAVIGPTITERTGADKTSIVVFFGEDRPGLLLRVLDEFSLRGINLTKIESRPTKQAMGEYCILIDCAGHLRDARIAAALRSIHRHVSEVKVLGSYARADAVSDQPAPYEAEPAYAAARDWYDDISRLIDLE